jgi:hypothetical protein
MNEAGVASASPSLDPERPVTDGAAATDARGVSGSVQLSLFGVRGTGMATDTETGTATGTSASAAVAPAARGAKTGTAAFVSTTTATALPSASSTAPPSSRRARRVEPLAREARLPTEPQRLGAALAASVRPYLPPGKGLSLIITENHYSMIAVRRRADGYAVRVHRMFAAAEPRIVRALARYVVHNDVRASKLLGEFIEAHQHEIAPKPPRTRALVLRTAGQFHDLQIIFDDLNGRFFSGNLEARITWGPAPRRRGPRRSIKMGSYAVEDRLIRVHPALDRADVPGFFVSWIVYHEMLHGKHDIVRQGTRRVFHSEAFLADERSYPDYALATAWEKANLDKLLASL